LLTLKFAEAADAGEVGLLASSGREVIGVNYDIELFEVFEKQRMTPAKGRSRSGWIKKNPRKTAR